MSTTVWLLLGVAHAALPPLPTAPDPLPENFPLWRVYPRLPSSRSLALLLVALPPGPSDWASFLLSDLNQRLGVPVTTHTTVGRLSSSVALSQNSQTYLLVVDHETTLLDNIQTSQPLWHPRSQFILILVANSPRTAPCTHDEKSRYLLWFEYLWDKYGILNVIAMSSGSGECIKVAVYNPFLPNEGTSWGQIRVLNGDDAEIFADKTRDLHGFIFRASMFPRLPTAVLTDKRTEFCYGNASGMDGEVLNALARYMNFTTQICEPPDQTEFGHLTEDNMFTGSIGDVLYGRADVAFNSRFIKGYKTDNIEFTPPIYNDNLCIVVPKAKRIPKWLKILKSMQFQLMILLVVIFFGSVVFLYALKSIRALYEPYHEDKFDFLAIWFDMLHPFLTAPLVRVPTVTSQRVFVMSCILFSLVVVSAFQGRLVGAISRTAYYRDITTLRELDESGLMIGMGSQNLDDTFVDTDDSTMHHLKEKLRYQAEGRLLSRIAQGDLKMAAIVRKNDVRIRMLNLTSDKGEQRLHLVDECPRVYFLSFVVRKGSPFLPRIDVMIRRLIAAGIVYKWEADVNVPGSSTTEVDEPRKVFTMSDLQLAFYILVVGLASSAAILMTELKYHLWCVAK